MTNIQQIKQISIRDYLTQRGIKPKQQNMRDGLYLSPLRGEHSPSFKVDYIRNLWYDFGLGEGGSIIDLAKRLEQCSFAEAIQSLGCDERIPTAFVAPAPATPTAPALRILSDAPLRHPALLGYLQRRGIIADIVRTYCREARYAINDREYFAISFPNNAGGWELRSERFKGCASPKQITTIDYRSDTAIVFEGFMDFLSYLSMKQPERMRIDAVVLNSVTNLPKAMLFLERHAVIHTFLDNDDAGRKATAKLKRLCPNNSVVDQSAFYRRHKDVNEYLQARQREQRLRQKKLLHGHKV